MLEKDLFLSGEAFDLLRFLSQQPEGCAPRADLAARFTDAETYLAALEDRGLIQGADAQALPQQPGCAVVGVTWRAVQLTPQGRICLRIHDAQRDREQQLQAQLEDFRRQLLKTQQQTADALQRMRQEFAEQTAQQQAADAAKEEAYEKTRRKDVRRSKLQFLISVLFTVVAVILGAYLEFDQALLQWLFNLFHG